ncbi:CUE domain-containing protein 1 isoform X1 [Erythrolamprus reginae]|uniref:CUE domain-containing protein 1 isoform X1 n=1 Tax=Erythrolamprus reginae TaxID=121349 RepID=UPI00396CC46F
MEKQAGESKAGSPAGPKEKEKGKTKEKSKASHSPASAASLKEAEKRIKALEKKLEAALQPSPSVVPLTQRQVTTPDPMTPQSAYGPTGAFQEGDWSPDGQFFSIPQAAPSPSPSWTRPESVGPARRGAQPPSATFTPTAAGLRSQQGSWQHMPPDMQELMAEIYSQGVTAGSSQYARRAAPQTRNLWPAPPPSGLGSLSEEPVFGEDSDKEYEFSEDENPPEQQPVAGLFKPALFRTLLFKAKQVMNLQGTKTSEEDTGKTSASLLREPQPETDSIPASHIFIEGVKKPWQYPAAAQGPSNLERKFYTFDEEVEKLLEFPPIDQPVVTLVSSALVPSETGESLKPEDRKAETLLRKTHQMAGWGFRAAAAASFFNRASIMWLQEMQSRIGPEEGRLRQDLSKLLAAAEFSADATLHAAKFASRGMATTLSSRRLLWLRNWPADLKSKWRLASAPLQGSMLFGEILDKVLIEDKDKKKVLPRSSRRQDRRFTPYTRRQNPRWETPTGSGQTQRPFNQNQYTQQPFRSDRGFSQDRQRGYQSTRRPFRGYNQRGFRRSK